MLHEQNWAAINLIGRTAVVKSFSHSVSQPPQSISQVLGTDGGDKLPGESAATPPGSIKGVKCSATLTSVQQRGRVYCACIDGLKRELSSKWTIGSFSTSKRQRRYPRSAQFVRPSRLASLWRFVAVGQTDSLSHLGAWPRHPAIIPSEYRVA